MIGRCTPGASLVASPSSDFCHRAVNGGTSSTRASVRSSPIEPQRGLAGDVQGGGDHSLGAGRGEVEILQLRLEGARQFVELPVQFQPARQCSVDDRGALVVDDGGALTVR